MKKIIVLLVIAIGFATACKKTESTSNQLEEVSGLTNFETKIQTGVSLVFYHASWCSVCKAQRPAVESTAKSSTFSNVFFGEVEFEDNSDIAQKYNVQGFPTIVIYKDGVEKERLTGKGHSQEKIEGLINSHL